MGLNCDSSGGPPQSCYSVHFIVTVFVAKYIIYIPPVSPDPDRYRNNATRLYA